METSKRPGTGLEVTMWTQDSAHLCKAQGYTYQPVLEETETLRDTDRKIRESDTRALMERDPSSAQPVGTQTHASFQRIDSVLPPLQASGGHQMASTTSSHQPHTLGPAPEWEAHGFRQG